MAGCSRSGERGPVEGRCDGEFNFEFQLDVLASQLEAFPWEPEDPRLSVDLGSQGVNGSCKAASTKEGAEFRVQEVFK